METTLNYCSYGQKKSPAIIFLHGFMGSSHDFLFFMKRLSREYFCIAFDLPGHGKSLFKNNKKLLMLDSLYSVALLILEDIAKIGIENFVLYGYSMGGRIAQEIAFLSKKVTLLLLESSSFGIIDKKERELRYRKDLCLFDGVDTKETFIHFLKKWHALPLFQTLQHSPNLPSLIAAKQKNNIGELKQALKILSVGKQRYCLDSIEKLEIPIYYFYGEKDQKYSSVVRTLETKKIETLPFVHASHNIHFEFPEAFFKNFLTILEQNRGRIE